MGTGTPELTLPSYKQSLSTYSVLCCAALIVESGLEVMLFLLTGTCINNTSVMMFKKGSFEIGATVYPVAIKVRNSHPLTKLPEILLGSFLKFLGRTGEQYLYEASIEKSCSLMGRGTRILYYETQALVL